MRPPALVTQMLVQDVLVHTVLCMAAMGTTLSPVMHAVRYCTCRRRHAELSCRSLKESSSVGTLMAACT